MTRYPRNKSVLLAATVLATGLATPTQAQDATSIETIVVTARRFEEKLQDVPLSITVLDPDAIARNNITTALDISTYVPSVVATSRFGEDGTTFTIRGFSQEANTSPTVGIYFAEVAATRGGGDNSGGDGAGVGKLFDLENIQVLKGPQGTLFGRNTTGGAILLTPVKPKDEFGGYAEGSVGNFNMHRIQGVINAPLSDRFRIRLGVDHMRRDGWMENFGVPGRHGGDTRPYNVNFTALRLGMVADITDKIENYTLVSWSNSDTNGALPKTTQCFPGVSAFGIPAGNLCVAQTAREALLGGGNFWVGSNAHADPRSHVREVQISNTTKWQITDNIEIKNIFSYAEFRNANLIDFFGNAFVINPALSPTDVSNLNTFSAVYPSVPQTWTNAESTTVEELRASGNALDGRLLWQTGLYFERSKPLGVTGRQTATFAPCANMFTFTCTPATAGVSAGIGAYRTLKANWENKAVYGQATYDITDTLSVTGGIRYTHDRAAKDFQNYALNFATGMGTCAANATAYTFAALPANCWSRAAVKTSAPTWLVSVDYKPISNVLVYANYARGYRQGGVNAAGTGGFLTFTEEKLDSYEVGFKSDWHGMVPGSLNASAFYNNFSNQQLTVQATCDPVKAAAQGYVGACPGTSTSIFNVGKSRLYGFEVQASISPVRGLNLGVAYTYLNSKVQSARPFSPGLPYTDIVGVPVGSPLTFSIPNQIQGNIRYTLPLSGNIGEISIGGTFVYNDAYLTAYGATNRSITPSRAFANLNLNWEGIAGRPIDAQFFVTNVTNEADVLNINDQATRGFVTAYPAPPRMFGMRLKYRFGATAN